MDEPLKPCPFCGGEPDFRSTDDGAEYIECMNPRCEATTHLQYGEEAKRLLAEMWNRRTPIVERRMSSPFVME